MRSIKKRTNGASKICDTVSPRLFQLRYFILVLEIFVFRTELCLLENKDIFCIICVADSQYDSGHYGKEAILGNKCDQCFMQSYTEEPAGIAMLQMKLPVTYQARGSLEYILCGDVLS